MRWNKRRERMRELLESNECYHPASIFDPMSARVAEDIGFEMGMFAGSTASLTVLGAPDHIVLTLSEFADQGLRICRSIDMPLVVDADHGYGNALSVMRTVEELEISGIAAMTIEDTELPMVYGKAGSTQILSIEEGVGKMRAALEARNDPNMVILGRTSAMGVTSPEDGVARAKAYEAAGVDALFMLGVKDKEQIEWLRSEVKIPLMLAGFTDKEYLASQGVRICLQGHQSIRASVQAIHNTLKALRDGTSPKDLTGVAGGDLMGVATKGAEYSRWIKDYL